MAPPPPESAGSSTFVGRGAELGALLGALDHATGGRGRLVLGTGAAGIGKTALVEEFVRRARQRQGRPFTLCRGRCAEQYGAGEAYLPFLDGLGALLRGRHAERTREILRTYAPTW